MQKTKKLILASAFFVLVFALAVFIGFGKTTASAATYTTPKYTTYGSYSDGGTVTGGSPSQFKIYMHGSGTSGTSTMYNDKLTDWSYYYIKVGDSGVRSHKSFKLYRNGYLHTSKTLSGTGEQTLYSGNLSDGKYELQYVANIGSWLSNRDYTYTYRFEVDKTAPNYTLKAGGSTISSGSYTSKQIVYTASDANFNYIRFKKPTVSSYSYGYNTSYTVAATVENNGWWYFYAMDDMGASSSTVSVYLDTVKPIGTLKAGGYAIGNGGYTNKSVSFIATDAGGVSYYQYKTPTSSAWQSYRGGTSISGGNGWYAFRAVDLANNISEEYRVYYDASMPVGALYGGTASKASGSYTNAEYVKYVAGNPYSGIANCYVKLPNTSYYTSYTSGSQLTTEGTYSFYCVSRAGTSSATVSITLDKTKPVGTLYGGTSAVANGSYTNASDIRFLATDRTAMTAYVKKPGSASYAPYALGTQFTEEGTYRFYVIDAASNRSDTYTITLSRQIPAAQLYVDGAPLDNNGYTNGGHISFECDETCYVMLPGTDSYVSYASGTEYYKPGKYAFYGISPAQNHSGYYTVVIDRTEKPLAFLNVTDGVTDGDAVIDWADGDPDVFAPVKTVTVNGKRYEKGETIHTIDTGIYSVICEDAAGNLWSGEFRSAKRNVLTETLQKEYYESHDADGKYYAFSTYESALAYAKIRESGYIRTGEWKSRTWDTGIAMDAEDSVNAANGVYYIYKKSGSPDEEVAYFTQERMDAVIAEYAKIGIHAYYYWEKAPAAAAEGENLFSYSDGKNVLAHSVMLGENVGALLNGEAFVGTVVEREGRHVLTVFDEWGNACDYGLIIIRKAPGIEYAVAEGSLNTVSFDRLYRFKDQVTVSIADAYDEMAMFSVYDENGELIGHWSLDETCTLTESGTYTVVAVNHAGQSEAFVFIISRSAPSVVLSENAEKKQLIVTVNTSADDESHLQTLEIYKSKDNGETWVLIEKDDYGTLVSLDTLVYRFRTTRLYKVVVTDEFRTGIDAVTAQLDYVQAHPKGVLIGAENGGFTNGSVSFTWTDEAVVTVERNGELLAYASGTELNEDGEYVLTFENFDGYLETYTFTIDTVAPEIKLEGAENTETVNTDVKALFTEEALAAELFKNGKSLGSYESGTFISVDGNYRIVLSDRAGNNVEAEFTIDKTVDYAVNVNDRGISNSVIAAANEQVTVTLIRNGETMEYALGSAVTEPGEYVMALTDSVGNTAQVSFTVIEPLVKAFSHCFDDVPGFAGVTVNGEEKRLNYGTLELAEDGEYEIGVIVGGNTYLCKVTVDHTPPTITVNGVELGGSTKGSAAISAVSEPAELKLYKDGHEIQYALGGEIVAPGEYRIAVTDACGNTAEYGFTIEKSLSGGTIALIVIACLLVIGGVVVFILKRKQVV